MPAILSLSGRRSVCLCIFLIFKFLAFINTPADGQVIPDSDPNFDSIFAMHSRNMLSLYEGRGLLGYIETGEVFLEDLTEKLKELYPENDVAILFYAYTNDQLSIHLIDVRGFIAHEIRYMDYDELVSFDKKIKSSFIYTNENASRIPEKRGAGVALINVDEDGEIPDIRSISRQVIPFGDTLLAYSHLIIVPTLNMGSLPFAMLKPFKDDSYLIDHLSYSISPSLFEFMVIANFTESGFKEGILLSPNDALLVGNPEYPQSTSWIFPDLPGAAREVAVIETILKTKSKMLTGKDASKNSVYWNGLVAPDHVGIIHLATHGISDVSHPLDSSFLVLAGEGEEAFLTARDIQNIPWERGRLRTGGDDSRITSWPLDCPLVVMSACQTGLGGIHPGGTVGLARAWQIAGVRNVVMSLWNIDDEVTAKLMAAFYENLSEPRPFQPASSLRDAMLTIKDEYPEYKYWAAFSIFGLPAR